MPARDGLASEPIRRIYKIRRNGYHELTTSYFGSGKSHSRCHMCNFNRYCAFEDCAKSTVSNHIVWAKTIKYNVYNQYDVDYFSICLYYKNVLSKCFNFPKVVYIGRT